MSKSNNSQLAYVDFTKSSKRDKPFTPEAKFEHIDTRYRQFDFLREYKGYFLYDHRNPTQAGPSQVYIVDKEGNNVQQVEYQWTNPANLNKAIEKAKQWVNVQLGNTQQVGKYYYNEHGVCNNPDTAFHLKTKLIVCTLQVAQTNSGWAYGYDLDIKSAGGSGSGVWIAGPHYETKELAILAAAEHAWKYFSKSDKSIPAKELKPLGELIGMLQKNNVPEKLNPVQAKQSSSPQNKNAMLQSQLQFVKLSDINVSDTNHHQREDWELQENALKELAESIKQKGVIQPIVLRPNGKVGKYFLVCGERRFHASLMAEQKDIPAIIKELTEEEAFDLQITENLQRKDVHPMKEAQAYKALMDSNPEKNTVAELANRFGKTPDYIAQRLSFNNLTTEMRKDFYAGRMMIGHALLFARLTEADQKECAKNCKIKYGPSADTFEPVKTVQVFIQEKIIRKLNDAIFNPNDAELYTAAGACTSCPKRSGANHDLFADIKETDRCFDGGCFQLKTSKYMVGKLENLRQDNPDIPVIGGHASDAHHVDSVVKTYLKKNSLKLLKEWTDYETVAKSDKGAVKAFAVGGQKMGQAVYIKYRQKVNEKGEAVSNMAGNSKTAVFDEQIGHLKATLKKVKDDAAAKVQEEIIGKLMDLKPYTELIDIPLNRYEEACVYLHLYDDLGPKQQKSIRDVLNKMNLKFEEGTSKQEQLVEQMSKAPAAVRNFLARHFIEDDIYDKLEADSLCGIAMRKAATQFKGIDIAKIETQFNADVKKQEETIAAKIMELEGKKKEAMVNAKNKTGNKKAVKK